MEKNEKTDRRSKLNRVRNAKDAFSDVLLLVIVMVFVLLVLELLAQVVVFLRIVSSFYFTLPLKGVFLVIA